MRRYGAFWAIWGMIGDVGQIHVSIYMAVMVANGMIGMHVTHFGKGEIP